MSNTVVRRLRPQLFTRFNPCQRIGQPRAYSRSRPVLQEVPQDEEKGEDYKKRIAQLDEYEHRENWYPRLSQSSRPARLSLKELQGRYADVAKGETRADEPYTVVGRIQSIRSAGSKLVFLTIEDDRQRLQIVIKSAELPHDGGLDKLSLLLKVARKGDWFSFTGLPHRTHRGELSLLATESPLLQSPSLHQIPERLDDAEMLSHHRHVDMLVHPSVIQTLRVRHTLERTLDEFLASRDFTKVSTPILQYGAGGAVARPFETQATELSGKNLHLRIAPELWLKRLVIGGMSRVYETGPVFRNEGVDATHNPEFTICEFYAAHTTLEELMRWTEDLMTELAAAVQKEAPNLPALDLPDLNFDRPFNRIEFLPALESALGHPLPDLSSPDALSLLESIFSDSAIPLPTNPSLPRLLDALAAHHLEPLCHDPTFITHHPAALSPLSKHFRCPKTGQLVAARAELFVARCELANMYEEQNSPFAQRAALLQQLRHRALDRDGDGRPDVDEAYLEALEWGLPPTGGWGCGVDRLVMLFAGRHRVGDVLSFGGLRNVVGVGRRRGGSASRKE